MNKQRTLILTVGLVFALACSISVGNKPTPLPTTVPPTLPALSTYTPLPTYTLPAIIPTFVEPTITITLTPTSSIPLLSSNLIMPNKTYYGDTTRASDLWYFTGQAGQIVSITLGAEKYYQFFSVRDDKNEGLIGCEVQGNKGCSIDNYRLPYSGVYYILVDRTMDDRYKKSQSCITSPPYPDWCFRGGPYSLTLTIQ